MQGSRFTNNSDSLSASLDLLPRLLNTSSMAFISAWFSPERSCQPLPEVINRLCKGECFNPSDERKLISRIEVVRIRPQAYSGEPIENLIEDPWKVFQCGPSSEGCEVEFTDDNFTNANREIIYYVRAIQEPSLAINASNLNCDRDDSGKCIKVNLCGDVEGQGEGDCLSEIEERAWSSPVFIKVIGNIENRLTISSACSLIQPYHVKLDQLREGSKKLTKIGTTGRGIGTAYEDRVGRRSIRVADLYNENKLKDRLEEALDFYNSIFIHSFNSEEIDLNELFEKNLKQAEKLKPYVGNVIQEVRDLQEADKKILFEGAQGALLDVSLGTYPYVTSSNSSVGGIASGIGISPTNIDFSLGIAKAYTTRVGEGPFPRSR